MRRHKSKMDWQNEAQGNMSIILHNCIKSGKLKQISWYVTHIKRTLCIYYHYSMIIILRTETRMFKSGCRKMVFQEKKRKTSTRWQWKVLKNENRSTDQPTALIHPDNISSFHSDILELTYSHTSVYLFMSLWYSMTMAAVYDSTAKPPVIRQIWVLSKSADVAGLTETQGK